MVCLKAWKSSSSAVTVLGNEADINKAVIRAVNPGDAKITAVITNTATGGNRPAADIYM